MTISYSYASEEFSYTFKVINYDVYLIISRLYCKTNLATRFKLAKRMILLRVPFCTIIFYKMAK